MPHLTAPEDSSMHLGLARALVPLLALFVCGTVGCGDDGEVPTVPRDSAPERPPGCEGACASKPMPQIRCENGALAVYRCGFSDVRVCEWVDPRCPAVGDAGPGDGGGAGADGGDSGDGPALEDTAAGDGADAAAEAPDDAAAD
jgi:hypothetical protein